MIESAKIKDFIKKVKPVYDIQACGLKNMIHIAGTNGKGSTAFFLAKILEFHNFTVNIFSSPHLLVENERIKIHSYNISDKLLHALSAFIDGNLRENLTYFEHCFLKSLLAFKQYEADFNIVESGIGAKHDITNSIVGKKLAIITSISFDHENILGNTIEQIAEEKCALMRKDTPCVVALQKYNIENLIKDYGNNIGAKVFMHNKCYSITNNGVAVNGFIYKIPNYILNSYQVQNAATAIYAAYLLLGNKLCKNKVFEALNKCVHKGRITELEAKNSSLKSLDVKILLDCAHNKDAFNELYKYIKGKFVKHDIYIVVALQKTKNLNSFISTFNPIAKSILCVPISNDFYKATDILKANANMVANVKDCINWEQIEKTLLSSINKNKPSLVVFTGSFYLLSFLIENGFKFN